MKDVVFKAASLLIYNFVLRLFLKFKPSVHMLAFHSSKKYKKNAVFLCELHKALYLCCTKKQSEIYEEQ